MKSTVAISGLSLYGCLYILHMLMSKSKEIFYRCNSLVHQIYSICCVKNLHALVEFLMENAPITMNGENLLLVTDEPVMIEK